MTVTSTQWTEDGNYVIVTVEVGDSKGASDLRSFANRLYRYFRDREVMRQGGKHWRFERAKGAFGVYFRACFYRGDEADHPFVLAAIRPRRKTTCASCKMEFGIGQMMWRQGPSQWAGFSRLRFCDACVRSSGDHTKIRPVAEILEDS